MLNFLRRRWVSQCERQQIRVALGTLDRFVRLQAGNAGVARTAIEWIAQCLLIQKNYKTAADLLKQAPAGFAPRRDQFLARRWYRLAGIDPDHPEPEKKKEEKKKIEKNERE